MRSILTLCAFILLLVCSCGGSLKQHAETIAVNVDRVADVAGPTWASYVSAKVSACRNGAELASRAEAEKCLGIAAKSPQVADMTEALVASQVALYTALAEDKSSREVRMALAELLVRFRALQAIWAAGKADASE